jgi:hypothetical protein
MAEVGNPTPAVATPTPVSTADPTPAANPTASQPEGSATPQPVPAGAVGRDIKALETAGEKVIASFAKMAGLGELKSDGSHQGNVVNAGKVFKELTELGRKDPALKAEVTNFLKELAVAGKAFYNWGQKLDGVPLNQLKASNAFKGVDAANKSDAAPMNESGAGSQDSAKGMTPDEVRKAVTPLLQQVAAIDKKGDANTIALTEVGEALKSKDMDPQVRQLLTLIQTNGKDMTVADAANFVASKVAASQQGSTQQTQTTQGNPDTTRPAPQQTALPDIQKLDVPTFVSALDPDGNKVITRDEMQQGLQNKDMPQDGKAFLQFLLSKVPDDGKPVTTPKALSELMTSLQAQQAQPRNTTDAARG